jgi:hypothetical protein
MDTFWWNLKLSTLHNLDCLCWLIPGLFWNLLNLLNDFVTLENLAKDDVFAVEMTMRVLEMVLSK